MRQWAKLTASRFLAFLLEPLLVRVLKPRGACDPGLPSVHTLVSERTWRMGLLAVASFEFFSGSSWPVYVHDDGSVSASTIKKIARCRPHWRFISRRESDERARAKLAEYPQFLRLRQRHPLAVKMADAWLWAQQARYIFIDSDTLFFRRPEFILKWIQADDGTCWFMEEYEGVYSYSLPPEALRSWAGFDVMPRVNTGIGLLYRDLFDWTNVERLLSAPVIAELDQTNDWYIEQTLCAVLLSRWGKGGLLPSSEYITGYDAGGMGRRRSYVACHYVGPTKRDRYYYHGLVGILLRWESLRGPQNP